MHQATIYQYNQRAEILIPERRGTSYYGPDNHKPLVCYKGLNIDIDFFAKDTDRKPQTLHNKTYTCKIIDRTSGAVVINKQLMPHDYDNGILLLHLDHEETSQLDAKTYDVTVTYTLTNSIGSYGGTSDQNMRLSYVLDVRDQPGEFRASETVSVFQTVGDDRVGGRMTGPAQNANRTGLQTAQVHTTDYTGVYKFQGTLSIQPTDSDWFDIAGQSYTLTSNTGIKYHTFYGQYQYVRIVHTPDVANTGTLDKVVYRS